MLHMAKENKEDTGKSFSETLFLASTKPQYDDNLFIDRNTSSIQEVQYMLCTQIFVLTFRTIYMHNMSGPCSFHVLTELVIQ